jgi:hypothetical protein
VSFQLLVAATTGSQVVGRAVALMCEDERLAEAYILWTCVLLLAEHTGELFEVALWLDSIAVLGVAFFGGTSSRIFNSVWAQAALFNVLGSSTILNLIGFPWTAFLLIHFMSEHLHEMVFNPPPYAIQDFRVTLADDWDQPDMWAEVNTAVEDPGRVEKPLFLLASHLIITLSQLLNGLMSRLEVGESADFVSLL